VVSARQALGGRAILVVEDDYLVADDIVAVLRRAGARVAGPVATGEDALSLIQEEGSLDLAVLDVKLRREVVYGVAEALEARGVPFVFATGYDRADLPDRFAGAPLIEKPFDAGQLVRVLAALPDAPRPSA
jgi:CheY-like chemotaxis protein